MVCNQVDHVRFKRLVGAGFYVAPLDAFAGIFGNVSVFHGGLEHGLQDAAGLVHIAFRVAADLFGVALNILGTDFRKNEVFPKRFAKHRQDGRGIRTMMKAASAIQIMPFFAPFRQWDIRPGILAFRLFDVRFFLGVGFTLGFPIKEFLDGFALLVAAKR